jgi:hypothetical protein
MASKQEETNGADLENVEKLSMDFTGVDRSFFVAGSKSRKLPKWLDHFNARDLKIVFKCSMAVWITTILIFINPTLRVIGQAGFFGWSVFCLVALSWQV